MRRQQSTDQADKAVQVVLERAEDFKAGKFAQQLLLEFSSRHRAS